LKKLWAPSGLPANAAPQPARGRYATLAPPTPEHASALFQRTREASLWDYLPEGPFADEAAFADAWARKVLSPDPLFYTILVNDQPLGHASLMRIDPPNGSIEVGHILYSPALQRTPAATEAQYLLARYIFDALGYRRYEWKCNALNTPSRRAALRYGFQFEGIFRQHLIVKGRNRDTAWFSMLDSEWPARKAAWEAWLEPSNFDDQGRQRQRLGALS
jgi:RimJ/RimL family protein N-acetyltransferase